MFEPIHHKTAILPLRKSISRSPLRLAFPLIPLALACFALLPMAQAQLPSPTPDGGYPGGNTAEGDGALSSVQINTSTLTGVNNTATGFFALNANTTGGGNTATGFEALVKNTTGGGNTATGFDALFSNTTGGVNTANGVQALYSNATGSANTANGFEALFSNTTGSANTANGDGALFNNTTGSNNTANGFGALDGNITGNNNTAVGYEALLINQTASNNTAIGDDALFNTTGKSNIALGFNAGSKLTMGNNNIDIGNVGVAGESNKIRIGTVGTQDGTFIAGINGTTIASGVTVIVNTNGHLGTVTSSERFKEAIKPMDKASEAILALQPVTFRYKHELDPDGIPQFGLVAEQVEKVDPDLVARDAEGNVYTVRYEAVNAMLLNEFLKEHSKVQTLEATVTKQQKEFESKIAQQQKQIEALTAGLQNVSDQLELSKPAPQMVADNQ